VSEFRNPPFVLIRARVSRISETPVQLSGVEIRRCWDTYCNPTIQIENNARDDATPQVMERLERFINSIVGTNENKDCNTDSSFALNQTKL
jgi:hypothetical protein